MSYLRAQQLATGEGSGEGSEAGGGGVIVNAPTLFDVDAPPRARKVDDIACHDAARRVRVGQYDAGIFELLNTYRCLTKNQICAYLRLEDPRAWTTVASRLSQLKNAGKLEWTGRRIENEGNLWRLRKSDVDVQGGVL